MSPRARPILIIALLASAGLPAVAQESLLPPGFGNEQAPEQAPAPAPATTPGPDAAPAEPREPRPPVGASPASDLQEVLEVAELTDEDLEQPPPPIEIPDHARRDPYLAGVLDPVAIGLGADPWGTASGAFLSSLVRRIDAPLPSRWLHIGLRNALLAEVRAPRNFNPVDWTADRSWLLLKMGEADAARMLVARVDVDRFSPRMFQVAVQSALASSDPAALCPLRGGIDQLEPKISSLTAAICSALSGEAAQADATAEAARRRGRVGGIDLLLAEKLIGVGTDTRRAVTIEWDGVDHVTSWRYGMATSTGMALPDRLVDGAPPRVRAWLARAPLLSAEQRLKPARTAAGLGVFSSSALLDLYGTIYDGTDPNELGQSDAWQVRTAFVGRDEPARLAAMNRLWSSAGDDPIARQAAFALLSRAAARITPSEEYQADAEKLIASMLAAGFDREAARWSAFLDGLDPATADRCWAMLALASPGDVRINASRLDSFIDRDRSEGRQRSALLVAGLAGLGRINQSTLARLVQRHALAIERPGRWSSLIAAAAERGQSGTALVLAATGLQAREFEDVPAANLLAAIGALRRTGQEYLARMVAAEALIRT